MIKHMKIEAFKSFDTAEFDFKPLSLLAGVNSSGKSTVIQAIRILEKGHLLDGCGQLKEVKSRYSDKKFSIHLTDSNNKNFTIRENDKNELEYYKGGDFPKILYISAERFGPKLLLNLTNTELIGSRGENVIKFIQENRDEIINNEFKAFNSEGNTLKMNLDAYLSEMSFKLTIDPQLIEKTDSSYALINNFRSINVGFGISYILPILASLLYVAVDKNKDIILMLENPEAHIHPRGQCIIAELIAKLTNKGRHIIVETHSDHFMDKILEMIREGKISKTNIGIFFFSKSSSFSKKEDISITDSGRIEYHPDGFFREFANMPSPANNI